MTRTLRPQSENQRIVTENLVANILHYLNLLVSTNVTGRKKRKKDTAKLLDGLLSNGTGLKAKLLDPRVNLVLST